MSNPLQASPSFEVRCENCDVTFPVGTKQCIHCGGRIGRPFVFGRGSEAAADELPDFDPLDERAMEQAEEAEDPQRGRGLRFGVTALWLIAALLSALVRACQDG